MRITGLPDDDQQLLAGLVGIIAAKRGRNRLRDSLMEGRRAIDRWGLVGAVPDRLRAVVGWPAKGVETLARRCNLEGFTATGGDFDALGLAEVLDRNQYLREAPQAHVSSLVHAVSFQVVTRGATGEPDQIVTRVSALDGTGEWDPRRRRLSSFVEVSEWDAEDSSLPRSFHLFRDGSVTIVEDLEVADVLPQPLGRVPVEPLVYKPRLGRPFGSSRISRSAIFLTQSAARVITRSEGTADLYSAPGLIAFGLTAEQLAEGAWRQGIGNVVGIPDADPDSAATDALARAQVQVIQQASQQPHVDQLRAWAQLFAGEMSIPVESLGLSIDRANPTSAEAYTASREDLIAEAEDATREWGAAHVRTVQMLWALREGRSMDDLPAEVLGIRAKWRDPRHVSQSAAADAFTKIVPSLPWVAESDVALDMLGLSDDLVVRLKADRRRLQARATLSSLIGPDADQA